VKRLDTRRVALLISAPVAALALAALLASIALVASNINPGYAFREMVNYGVDRDSLVDILDRSTYYYMAAVAVAVGFRMNLFNIGVDGQYQLAAMMAAAVGGATALHSLPGPVLLLLITLTAVVTGAAWAGIAGLLKVTRGVSEVISTIMLNAIGAGIVAYLISQRGFGILPAGANQTVTRPIPAGAWVPELRLIPGARHGVFGFIIVAVALGIGYALLLRRTTFGFDLRAGGLSGAAARASGVDVKRMVVAAMLISGGIAGLVGLPLMLGSYHNFTSQFPGGIGFVGIAVALIGRNHPVGMAFAALLWSFLDRSAQILDIDGIPKEIVQIMQGASVLAVVVAYEVARRVNRRLEQRRVGVELGTAAA
jgi:ABC-type uncharacterized transport system permease subunit